MSSTLRIPPRQRWAAKSIVLKRWFVRTAITVGEPVCDLEIDGTLHTIRPDRLDPADSPAGIYWFYVREGEEVGPWGQLLEYTTNGPSGRGEMHAAARAVLRRRDRYPSIFLNYRRDDADAYAGRIDEALSRTFGRDDVFMDEFSIRPGEVFSWTLQQAVVHARVVLSLIGPKWWNLTDARGQMRRIESEHDFVRREIVAALDRGITLLPVLLPGGSIPQSHFLDELWGLQDLQYHSISGAKHWSADVESLFAAVKQYM